jgi:hypothetical protein
LLQGGLQPLQSRNQLFLLACRETVPNAGTRPAEKLPRDGTIGTLNPARKNIIGQRFKAVAEPCQLG